MQHLDLQVIEQALAWSREGQTVWLCKEVALAVHRRRWLSQCDRRGGADP